MEKSIIRAFDISDFPFSNEIYAPKFEPSCIELISIENAQIGTTTELILSMTRIGNGIIPRGSKVISQSRYLVTNVTQNYIGRLKVIGVETAEGALKFFASSGIPLKAGDELTVEYLSDFEPVDKMRFH